MFADLNFYSNGTYEDVNDNVSIQFFNNPTVGNAVVRRASDGEKVMVPAFQTTGQGQYALCTFSNIRTRESMVEWVERRGFSVEAYYVSNLKQGTQGIVCATETVSSQGGGWGIAEKEKGKPYFLTASTSGYESANTTAATATSATELVHVVAVYDPFAGGTYGKQYLYVNGVCVNNDGETLDGPFVPIGNSDFNKFCIGADVRSLDAVKINGVTYKADYNTSRLTLLDAKIYDKALTGTEVGTAYSAAVATTAGEAVRSSEADWDEAYTAITIADQSKYFYRSQLAAMADQTYVQAYDKIYNAILDCDSSVSLSGISKDRFFELYRLVLSDHHEIFWTDYIHTGTSYMSRNISYLPDMDTPANVASYKAQIEAAADIILSGIRPDMTEMQRVKYVYDYLMDLVSYGDPDEGIYVHTLYAALIENAPVCDGYSHAFGYLLQKLGIVSFEVVGDTNAEHTSGHAWSAVKIGERYTLFDVTFSDTGSNDRYKYYDKPALHSDGKHYPEARYTTSVGFSFPVFS